MCLRIMSRIVWYDFLGSPFVEAVVRMNIVGRHVWVLQPPVQEITKCIVTGDVGPAGFIPAKMSSQVCKKSDRFLSP